MKINVKLTEDIINRSLHLHYANAPAKQKHAILFVPAALTFIAIYLVAKDWYKPELIKTTGISLFYIILGLAYFFYMRYRREHTGRQLMKSLGENSQFQMEVNEQDVITRLPDNVLNHHWNSFGKALLGADLVLLYQPNLSFSMFHKSFFPEGDFSAFKKLVKEQVMEIKEV